MDKQYLEQTIRDNHEIAIEQLQCGELSCLASMGVVQIQGPDAIKLMQGQFTCDAEKISESQAVLGAFCNHQGRMHALFHIVQQAEHDFLLLMPAEVIEHFVAGLSKYAVFFQVEIKDVSEDWLVVGWVQDGLTRFVVEQQDNKISLNIWDFLQIQLLPVEHGQNYLEQQQTSSWMEESRWQVEEIKAGLPQVYQATIEQFLPHYVNLPELEGVDFKKGCYTGQEVIARMHYRAKIKRHMQIACTQTVLSIEAGTAIKDENDKNQGDLIRYANMNGQAYCLISVQDSIVEAINSAQAVEIKLDSENSPILSLI